METVQLTVKRGRESERLATALYRYCEMKLSSADQIQNCVQVVTESQGDWEQRTIALWNDDATRDFVAYWRSFPPTRSLI